MSVSSESTNRCDVGTNEDNSLTDESITRLDVTVKDETNRCDLSPKDESLNRSDISLKEESNESEGKHYIQMSDGSDGNVSRQAFVDTNSLGMEREVMYKLIIR